MKPLNLIALLLFLAALVGVVLLPEHAQIRAQGAFLRIVSPFVRGGSETEHKLKSTLADLDSRLELEQQNQELTAQLQASLLIREERDYLREENDQLKTSLGFVASTPTKLLPAQVIRRDNTTWWRTLIIDKGSEHGVRTDQAVRTPEGLVGKVTAVSNSTSVVLLLTDELCRVPCMVSSSQESVFMEFGIVQGWRGGIQDRPELRMMQLPRKPKSQIGAAVYSSGEGGIFPKGIPVGRIQSVQEGNLVGEAILIPEVNFMNLEYVFVAQQTDAPHVEEKSQ